MKKQLTNLFEETNAEQVKNFASIINESLVTSSNNSNCKTFTTVDLWNIQRQGKTTIQKRHSF